MNNTSLVKAKSASSQTSKFSEIIRKTVKIKKRRSTRKNSDQISSDLLYNTNFGIKTQESQRKVVLLI